MEAIAGNHPHLLLRSCKGIEVIALNTIVRIEGISNYSKLFFLDGKTMVVAKLLKWFEEKLARRQFVRVHKTHVINTHFICGYVNGTGGKIELKNGEWINVSKRKKGIFIKYWMALSA
jgi:two-component system, LytTR family, response regulator